MAIYEFLCAKCGTKFEELVTSGAVADVKCPRCGAVEVKRLMSTFGYNGGSGFKSTASSSGGGCSSCGGGTCSTCH
ncbi:MAG: zinc ribbon domain-containing protein [Firmicutes bacterium]|nr:zinc ribbon domain-containing protein [Bacillota bacterium]MDH7496525.1 zinc ribbon domain-containing protein [Bacillota bacterium]